MSTRYGINTLALVGAAFLAVVSRSFGETSLEWTAFGVSALIALGAVAGIALRTTKGDTVAYGTLGLVGAWSLVAALTFSGTALTWLVLADAVAVALVALGALTAHEVTTEKVVHTIEVREQDRELQTV